MTIRLRFVHSRDTISDGIIFDTGGLYSHVECVTPEGKYLGAHASGGVQARDPGYDAATLDRELFVDLPADETTTTAFYQAADKHIGEPYDFAAIFGFVLHLDEHGKGKVICSAVMTLCLRDSNWFESPLSAPAHEISPRDLLLIISGRQKIA